VRGRPGNSAVLVLLALVASLGLSCSGDPATSPSLSPVGSIEHQEASIVVGGDRPVVVQIPPAYDATRPAPLLIVLHGYTASGTLTDAYLAIGPVAASNGILYAYPDGTLDPDVNRFWNASDACCDFHGSNVDDSAYLAGLVAEIGDRLAVDASRVYFVGHSNGGFMSYRMACEHADLVAAVASLAGSTPTDADCQPGEPVAVLQIHGTADDTVNYEGGAIRGVRYPGAAETARTWAAHGGCDERAALEPTLLDLDAGIAGPDGTPGETRVETYASGCRAGGHAELWTIDGGGHSPELTADFAELVVEFLLAHPKPGD
jgi:polyhydroxybutyrate depolymerase